MQDLTPTHGAGWPLAADPGDRCGLEALLVAALEVADRLEGGRAGDPRLLALRLAQDRAARPDLGGLGAAARLHAVGERRRRLARVVVRGDARRGERLGVDGDLVDVAAEELAGAVPRADVQPVGRDRRRAGLRAAGDLRAVDVEALRGAVVGADDVRDRAGLD